MKELMHTTPEGLTGADATWAAGVMGRDRAARNAAIARAEAAEAKLAEVTKERDALLDEKRQIIEDILAAGARCGCDANKLSVREVLESMARSAGAHAGMNAASDPLRPIGSEGPWKPRQPDGYGPGERPSPSRRVGTPAPGAGVNKTKAREPATRDDCGHVIRVMYDRAKRRLRWYAFSDDGREILSVSDTRREAREARRARKR